MDSTRYRLCFLKGEHEQRLLGVKKGVLERWCAHVRLVPFGPCVLGGWLGPCVELFPVGILMGLVLQ
jgi:hypothetical protein